MASKTFIAKAPTNFKGGLVAVGAKHTVAVVKGKTILDDHKCWQEVPAKVVKKDTAADDAVKAAEKEAAEKEAAEKEAAEKKEAENIKKGLNPDGSKKSIV